MIKFLLLGIHYPIIRLLGFFIFWIPKFTFRKTFEARNSSDLQAKSFREINQKADICFEFSSEGEYQQVASLITDALKQKKKVELVFFSPSVEKTILELAHQYPHQIRYLRYPLATHSPFKTSHSFFNWVTSSKLILVRYDLFPEFLLWSKMPGHELMMVWVSFKKERVKSRSISLMKKLFLKETKKIIYASGADQKQGQTLGFDGLCYDFRMEQIRRRIELRDEKFASIFPEYPHLKQAFEKYPRHKRLIIGNAWPSDLFLLDKLPKDVFVLVVPHQLTPTILQAYADGLRMLGRRVQEIRDTTPIHEGNTIVLNKKGVLCELYADFGKAYVGGGFETSVHSILEPLVAGSQDIAAGPLNHRSTEFDVAQDMGRITEVKNASDFQLWLASDKAHGDELALQEVFKRYGDYRKEVISC